MCIMHKVITLLEESGKKQTDFANKIGVPKQLISDWKSGRNKSYMKYLPQIADYFGVSVDYLLGKEDKKNPPDKPTERSVYALAYGGGAEKASPAELESLYKASKSLIAEKSKKKLEIIDIIKNKDYTLDQLFQLEEILKLL